MFRISCSRIVWRVKCADCALELTTPKEARDLRAFVEMEGVVVSSKHMQAIEPTCCLRMVVPYIIGGDEGGSFAHISH